MDLALSSVDCAPDRIDALRPLQNALFCPISASGSNFNPRNIGSIPVVKISPFLDFSDLWSPANERMIVMTVTLILLGVAALALIWVYRITLKPRRKHS